MSFTYSADICSFSAARIYGAEETDEIGATARFLAANSRDNESSKNA